jgi:hypothetical protein
MYLLPVRLHMGALHVTRAKSDLASVTSEGVRRTKAAILIGRDRGGRLLREGGHGREGW